MAMGSGTGDHTNADGSDAGAGDARAGAASAGDAGAGDAGAGDALDFEAAAQAIEYGTADLAEGVRAARARRTPRFQGR
jgi:hypothetical protein